MVLAALAPKRSSSWIFWPLRASTFGSCCPSAPPATGTAPTRAALPLRATLISLISDALKAEGLLTAAQLKAEPWGKDPLNVDYGTLYTSRYKILRAAYAAWRRRYAKGLHGCAHYYPDDYYAFALANDGWLNDYALYMALKTANGMKSWTQWPREYRQRDAAGAGKLRSRAGRGDRLLEVSAVRVQHPVEEAESLRQRQ